MSTFVHVLVPNPSHLTSFQPTGDAPIWALVLAILSTLVAYALLRGRDRTVHEIDSHGVLELAWLFAREPSDLRPLRDVERPTSTALRSAGRRITWDAQCVLEDGGLTDSTEKTNREEERAALNV
jgi:hypothetical protein